MPVTRKHTIYDVELGKATPVRLPGIESMNIRSQTTVEAEATSGAVYPEHIAMTAQEPDAEFTSLALIECLTEIGLAGLSIATLPTGLNLFAYKHAEGSGRAGASLHRQYSATEGLIVPTRISIDHRGDCRVSFDCMVTYDGTNDPFVITDLVTLPAAAADAARHTIGKTVLGGVTIDHLKNVELDFGQTIERESADSDKWPTHASIITTKPVFTFRGIDVEYLKAANIPLEGKAAVHADTTVYFRKRGITASGFVANGTAEHVKITGDGLAYVDDIYSSQGSGSGVEASVKLPCRFDGTNAPIVITLNSAIT